MIDARRPEHTEAGGFRPDDVDLAILRQLSQGVTTDVIARWAGFSERTVRRRLRALADELGFDSSIEVVVHAVRSGLI